MTDSAIPPSIPWDDTDWRTLQNATNRLIEAWRRETLPDVTQFVPVGPDDPRFAKMRLHLIETDREFRGSVVNPKTCRSDA